MRMMNAMQPDQAPAATIQRYARFAGAAMLLSIVFGFLGEAWIPDRIIVHGDAAATAANILRHPTLFRFGFATYLMEGLCDIALCLLFYVILKPVNRNLALLSAFFGIVSMAMYAVAESSYFAASLVVRDGSALSSFTIEQRNELALFCMGIFSMIATLFLGIYGVASAVRGYLIFRSKYLPKLLGALLMIGGAGFLLRSVTYIVAPAYSTAFMLMPMALAGMLLMFWLLVRGVDRPSLERYPLDG
jgi:hypothetical protein